MLEERKKVKMEPSDRICHPLKTIYPHTFYYTLPRRIRCLKLFCIELNWLLTFSLQTQCRQMIRAFPCLTSNKRSISGVCLLAGVRQRLSIIKTLMKSKTNFLAGWLVKYVLVPTLQYSDWLLFMPVSAAKALNSSAGEPTSSSRSVTWRRNHGQCVRVYIDTSPGCLPKEDKTGSSDVKAGLLPLSPCFPSR